MRIDQFDCVKICKFYNSNVQISEIKIPEIQVYFIEFRNVSTLASKHKFWLLPGRKWLLRYSDD